MLLGARADTEGGVPGGRSGVWVATVAAGLCCLASSAVRVVGQVQGAGKGAQEPPQPARTSGCVLEAPHDTTLCGDIAKTSTVCHTGTVKCIINVRHCTEV